MNQDYVNKIRQLVELQKIDDDIFKIREIQKKTPLEVKELEERFTTLEDKRVKAEDKLNHLTEQQKRILNEIEEESSRIKKSRNKLMQVGNDREFQAMMREMDTIEKINRDKEEEKVTILEAVQTQTRELEEINSELEELSKELEEKRGDLEKVLQTAAEELKDLENKRKQASSFIPEKVFQRYEFIRKRLEHPVIVDVDEAVCSGCNITIPPQTYIDLQSSEQILNCPNCQRIIFWREHFEIPGRPRRKKITQPVKDEAEETEDQVEQED